MTIQCQPHCTNSHKCLITIFFWFSLRKANLIEKRKTFNFDVQNRDLLTSNYRNHLFSTFSGFEGDLCKKNTPLNYIVFIRFSTVICDSLTHTPPWWWRRVSTDSSSPLSISSSPTDIGYWVPPRWAWIGWSWRMAPNRAWAQPSQIGWSWRMASNRACAQPHCRSLPPRSLLPLPGVTPGPSAVVEEGHGQHGQGMRRWISSKGIRLFSHEV